MAQWPSRTVRAPDWPLPENGAVALTDGANLSVALQFAAKMAICCQMVRSIAVSRPAAQN